jgi:hypothetical protein
MEIKQTNEAVFPSGWIDNNRKMKLYSRGCMEKKGSCIPLWVDRQ